MGESQGNTESRFLKFGHVDNTGPGFGVQSQPFLPPVWVNCLNSNAVEDTPGPIRWAGVCAPLVVGTPGLLVVAPAR